MRNDAAFGAPRTGQDFTARRSRIRSERPGEFSVLAWRSDDDEVILVRHGAPDEGHPLQPQDPPLTRQVTVRRRRSQSGWPARASATSSAVRKRARRIPQRPSPKAWSCHRDDGSLAEVDRYTDRYARPKQSGKKIPNAGRVSAVSCAILWKDDGEFRIGVLTAFANIIADPKATNDRRFHAWNANQDATDAYSGSHDRREIHDRALLGHAGAGESIDALRIDSVNETLIQRRPS